MKLFVFSFLPIFFVLSVLTHSAPPNVLFVLTDDQDVLLGSMSPDGPCQKIIQLIVKEGVTFSNGFANTPICCPSRAEIQTGRYMHNTKVLNNKCGGKNFINGPEKLNIAHHAKKLGYTTFYAGKYLNNYGNEDVGGTARIPNGWDQWYGLKGNSKYYDYTVSNNGVSEKHGDDYHLDYFTDRIANRSLEFLANVTKVGATAPFFMMLGTPASHGPNTPAPQYEQTYAGLHSPRLPSWNVTGQMDKHWLLRTIMPLDEQHANVSDVFFQRRWSVLRSVDDMVERLLTFLKTAGQLDNTYVIFSSDHGYHLGEFGMLYDKRMLYETDIRVPLLVRGPGIPAATNIDIPALHIDLAPTILDMMGRQKTPAQMDGRSWLPFVKQPQKKEWRSQFLVEYSGGNPLPNIDKLDFSITETDFEMEIEDEWFHASLNKYNSSCGANASDELSIWGRCSCTVGNISKIVHDQSPCDGKNNTYACLRTLTSSGVAGENNTIYCEFSDNENFIEYYDLDADPYNLHNLAPITSKHQLKLLHQRLLQFQLCNGTDCFDP